MDELLGGWLGGALGEWLRARVLKRRYRRARADRNVKVGALAHFTKSPEWRDRRGVLQRRGRAVSWKPGISAWVNLRTRGVKPEVLALLPLSAANCERLWNGEVPVGDLDLEAAEGHAKF